MKFKLPVRDGKPNFEIMDFEDKPIPDADLATLLTKESKVQAILRCGGIWVIAGKFGCTWTVEKLRVESSGARVTGGISFIDDDDDSEEDDDDEEVEDTSDEDE